VVDGPVLTGSVHARKHDEQRRLPARVQDVLKRRQALAVVLDRVVRGSFGPVLADVRSVDLGQLELRARVDEKTLPVVFDRCNLRRFPKAPLASVPLKNPLEIERRIAAGTERIIFTYMRIATLPAAARLTSVCAHETAKAAHASR
jgi:hypothetical protein